MFSRREKKSRKGARPGMCRIARFRVYLSLAMFAAIILPVAAQATAEKCSSYDAIYVPGPGFETQSPVPPLLSQDRRKYTLTIQHAPPADTSAESRANADAMTISTYLGVGGKLQSRVSLHYGCNASGSVISCHATLADPRPDHPEQQIRIDVVGLYSDLTDAVSAISDTHAPDTLILPNAPSIFRYANWDAMTEQNGVTYFEGSNIRPDGGLPQVWILKECVDKPENQNPPPR